MTPALERALRRRDALMNPRSRSGGDMAGLAAMFGAGAPMGEFGAGGVGDVGPTLNQAGLADQGPGMPGATTGGITAPGRTHFFIRGRGPTIDFGPILRPKSTGVDPMQGDPFRETTGVGGFFRRLLGDNSNELNAQWQQARLGRGMELEDRAARSEEQRFMQDQATARTQMQVDAANKRAEDAMKNARELAIDQQQHEISRDLERAKTQFGLAGMERAKAMAVEGLRGAGRVAASLFTRRVPAEGDDIKQLSPDTIRKGGKVYQKVGGFDKDGKPLPVTWQEVNFDGISAGMPGGVAPDDTAQRAAAMKAAAQAAKTQGAMTKFAAQPGITLAQPGESLFEIAARKQREAEEAKAAEEAKKIELLRSRIAPNYGSIPLSQLNAYSSQR